MVVVVLGNRLESTDIHEHLRGRVDLGIQLFRDRDAEALLMTGGQTNPDVPYAESEVMKSYAVEQGVDPDHILVESKGQDTIGNAYFSRRLVEDRLDTSTVCIATSCYHVARSVFIFEHCFGDAYDVVAPSCYDAPVAPEDIDEDRSMSLNREFFAPIQPGDIDAVRERLIETHDLYTAADVESS